MTTNTPVVPSVPFTRSMTSLLERVFDFDRVGLIFQSPVSVSAARHAWGSAVKARATTVEKKMRCAAAEMIVFIAFSIMVGFLPRWAPRSASFPLCDA
jgi:hypothetical protein